MAVPLKASKVFKVNKLVYMASRTYRFCLIYRKYHYEKRV